MKDEAVGELSTLYLARVSKASYGSDQNMLSQGFNRVYKAFNRCTGTEAYVCVNDSARHAVIVYRGTEGNAEDIATDMNISQKKQGRHNLHSGFCNAYHSVLSKVEGFVRKVPEGYTVVATGHSLGGALASLYAVYGERAVDRVVTFGSPRVGGFKWSQALTKANHHRYVNGSDLVARVPKWNYYHGGELHLITGKGEIIQEPPSWRLFWLRLKVWRYASDHSIDEYIDNLK